MKTADLPPVLGQRCEINGTLTCPGSYIADLEKLIETADDLMSVEWVTSLRSEGGMVVMDVTPVSIEATRVWTEKAENCLREMAKKAALRGRLEVSGISEGIVYSMGFCEFHQTPFRFIRDHDGDIQSAEYPEDETVKAALARAGLFETDLGGGDYGYALNVHTEHQPIVSSLESRDGRIASFADKAQISFQGPNDDWKALWVDSVTEAISVIRTYLIEGQVPAEVSQTPGQPAAGMR